eukprot:1653140-Alexandrium_andersonii.AAC.1
MPSDCVPCPVGTHTSTHTGGVCAPCQAGLHNDAEGQSRCRALRRSSHQRSDYEVPILRID